MSDANIAFAGSVPAIYDRYLGPVFFHHYADDLVARLVPWPDMRVLETACGTGIVTERLAARLSGGALVATDASDAMLAHAKARLAGAAGIDWRTADATSLPFADGSFDAVVCQFGIMFYPDKAAGVREAFRVLRPGGLFLFNVWDAIERNPVARIAHETLLKFFPIDAPQFWRVPFGFHDPGTISGLLEQAGFEGIDWTGVEKTGSSPSAREAALGLVEGNPTAAAIAERRPDALEAVKAALATNLVAELGDDPVRCPERALVFQARRPRR